MVVRGPSCNIGRGETGIPEEKEMEEEKELDLMKNTKYHTYYQELAVKLLLKRNARLATFYPFAALVESSGKLLAGKS